MWKISLVGLIVCVFTAWLSAADALLELRQYINEAKAENQTLAEQNDELRRQLAARQSDLAELRSRYAEMVMRTDQQGSSLAQMELAAANLLNGVAGEADRLRLLETLAAVRRAVLHAEERRREAEATVVTMVELCQPSAALRQESGERLKELQEALAECLRPLQAVEATHPGNPGAVAIVTVDAPAQMVVIDQGSAAGLRPGMRLRLIGGTATVKVIAVRLDAACAVLDGGNFGALVPGLLLQREP